MLKQTGNLVFLDIETFYDGKIGLGFKHQTTEEYIRDPRFEMIGFSYKINHEPTVWVSGDNRMMHATLRSLNLEQQIVVAHNAPWDLGALFFHYGVHAGMRICTMMMSAVAGLRPVVGGSLAKLGDALQIGTKGHEVVEAEGKRRQDFTPEGLARYGMYCNNDVDMMARLFYLLVLLVGQKHMRLINATVRMFTEPVFHLDKTILETRYARVQQMKRDTLERLGADMNVSPGQVGDMLRSNPKFAELLLANGITPGTKITKGEQNKADKAKRDPVPTFAFAKTDEFMCDLLEHPRSEIVSLAEARMGEKSAGEEGRLRRFLGIADRGLLPIPLTVGGAHTLRYAAWDLINVQNLPKRKGMDKSLSYSIKPPPGHAVATGDSSQIEARVLAYVAQQLDLLTEFRLKRDPYAALAALVYHRPVEDILAEHLADINPGAAQRFMGKTTVLACIAEGQLVLTDRGLVAIESVILSDRVWDGVEWVSHQGAVFQGVKDVIEVQGLSATRDHKVYLDGRTIQFGELENVARSEQGSTLILAARNNGWVCPDSRSYRTDQRSTVCSSSMPSLRLRFTDQRSQSHSGIDDGVPTPTQATAESANTIPIRLSVSRGAQSNSETLSCDHSALSEPRITGIQRLWRSWDTVSFYIRGFFHRIRESKPAPQGLQGYGVRSNQQRRALRTGEPAASNTAHEQQQQTHYQPRAVSGSESRNEPSVAPTENGSPDIWVYLAVHAKASGTGDQHGTTIARLCSTRQARTYDIVNAGPRHRFVVSGWLVSNCGYQLGVDTFAERNRIPVKVARPLVDGYRRKNDKIVRLWSHLQCVVLPAMVGRGSGSFGGPNRDLIKYDAERMLGTDKLSPYIELPTGERVWYHGLASQPGKYGLEYTYWKGREVAFVYGGSLTENIIQALAFSIMVDQALMIDKVYKIRMNCHDAWSVVEPIEAMPDVMDHMRACMSWVPPYMGDCPLTCDIKQGPSYGHT